MSKKRYVDTRFWDDNFVITLDPIEKLLFLYFITNPLTELSGAYEISLRRVAFDTGIDRDMVVKILGRFEKANKMIFRDGWILIVNFRDYQAINPKIQLGIERSLNCCPDWIKDRLSKPTEASESLSHLDLDFNLDSIEGADAPPTPNTASATTQPKTKATSFPDPFPISDAMAAWAAENVPGVPLKLETEKMVDYYRNQDGKKAVKKDWVAAWRNWMRNAVKFSNYEITPQPDIPQWKKDRDACPLCDADGLVWDGGLSSVCGHGGNA